ncbi:MAG: hypothetical protein CMD09_03195 [Flavobacteriales bacterium]|nr:hypothetical protein [Flavobacteriales bacterium]
MSDALTDTFEDRVLNWLLTTNSVTRPTTWYVGLFASGNSPTDSASGTELSGSNYSRVQVTFSVSGTSPTTATNTATLTFPTASGSWGSVTTAGIFDASSSGNLIAYANLSNAKTIEANDILQIAQGQLDVTLT